jgi:hypothetical protein
MEIETNLTFDCPQLDPSTDQVRSTFAATTFIRDYSSSPYSVTTRKFPLLEFYENYKNLHVYSYLGSLTTPSE